MRAIDAAQARRWYERWERQQELYAGDRAERFEALLDVVEAICQEPRVVLDLGSGPGSLAVRVAERFPTSTVVAVDYDPFLLALGAAAHEGIHFAQCAIGAAGWTDAVSQYAGRIDAIVSSTALHYPAPHALATIYADCSRLLGPASVLVNADQFYPTDGQWAEVLASIDDVRAERLSFSAPPEDWSRWWQAVDGEVAFADLLRRRATEVPAHTQDNNLSMDHHAALMQMAGFAKAGPVWQHGRSAVIAALT